MADQPNPWQRPPAPNGPRTRTQLGFALWAGLIIFVMALVFVLNRMFPGALGKSDGIAQLIYMVGIVAFVSRGVLFARDIRWGETARNIALWAGIAVILTAGYAMRDSFTALSARIHSELVPGSAVETAPHELTIVADRDGQFFVLGAVNGVPVRFMVDTGASDIVLSPDDAKRAGIDLTTLHYIASYETANGTGHGAIAAVNDLTIGPIERLNPTIAVNETEMTSSLLGMAFLKSLKSFEFSQTKLILRW